MMRLIQEFCHKRTLVLFSTLNSFHFSPLTLLLTLPWLGAPVHLALFQSIPHTSSRIFYIRCYMKEKFFLYPSRSTSWTKIYLRKIYRKKKKQALLWVHGSSVMKLRPKEMTKQVVFMLFRQRDNIFMRK